MSPWKERPEFFRMMPRRSFTIFLLGVACLFAAIGTINNAMHMERSNGLNFAFEAVVNGVNATLWATLFTLRTFKWLLPLLAYQALVFPRLAALLLGPPRVLTAEQLRKQWIQHDLVVMGCIIAGYVLFITFFRTEGKRYFAAHTAIQLASAIQLELVPAISTKAGNFEFYGVSVPSGTVGGDLLDVVAEGNSFCAYVADVAGHGVPAGVVMSMVKSAVRMRVASVGPCDVGLLPALNEVLQPLTATNAYATFVYVSSDGGPRLEFSLAGHLPIFHYRHATREVERRSVENLPVGMFARVNYQTAMLECQPGDLLAMITDGLTEIFDRAGSELGSGYIEGALAESATRPLAEIASHMLTASAAFGQATDDRTLLLARCLGRCVEK